MHIKKTEERKSENNISGKYVNFLNCTLNTPQLLHQVKKKERKKEGK
jgi:hypothetical protein